MLIDGDDDIAGDIRKALAGEESVIEVDPVLEEPVELPEEQAEKPSDSRVRGADGKFVAKPDETAQDNTDQPSEAVADPAAKLAIRAPASWSPVAKAEFDKLPLHVQQAVAKREQEIDHGLRRKSEEVKRYEPLEAIIAPRRAVWAAQGLDETSAIKTLLAAQDLLEQDARKGIEFLAKSYGVDLSAQPTQGQAQAPQPAGNSPQYEQLLTRFSQLEQQLQAAQTAPVVSQVEAFFADPKNLYAENVRGRMANLLNSGEAKDLADAYDKACWMDPEIRPLLQVPQVVTDPAKVARARAAAVSVTGSPANARGVPANANTSIEDDIRNALTELSGQA